MRRASLGDVVFVELPGRREDREAQHETFGTIEAVKGGLGSVRPCWQDPYVELNKELEKDPRTRQQGPVRQGVDGENQVG
jgi:glycine cleavage system H lipoate-binding protein